MLDIERIRQLVDMMVENDLVELSLRDGDIEVNLRRPNVADNGMPVPASTVLPTDASVKTTREHEASADAAQTQEREDADVVEIKSPMVGTFYAAPDPDSPPFVGSGAGVTANTVVCIIEAMKVFNEIKAEVAGTIEKVLVRNEEAVEYGQPLFTVRPA